MPNVAVEILTAFLSGSRSIGEAVEVQGGFVLLQLIAILAWLVFIDGGVIPLDNLIVALPECHGATSISALFSVFSLIQGLSNLASMKSPYPAR